MKPSVRLMPYQRESLLQYLFNMLLKEIVCYYLSKRLFTGSNWREFNAGIVPEFINSMFVSALQVCKGVRVIFKSEKPKSLPPKTPGHVFHWTPCCTPRDFTYMWVTRSGWGDMLPTLHTKTEWNCGQLAHYCYTFWACKTGWLHPDCLFGTVGRLYQLLTHSQVSFRKVLLGPHKTLLQSIWM